ncbi:MAG TPA: NAD(P)H-dependent oxidoreductase [Acidimicrobiales bacterium]|nr:NAD(P)H-dependent oxidoreductase [Acidimicrobiales bacterium]
MDTELFGDLDRLPHFNPDDDPPADPAVADLRRAIARAGAVLSSTPEYAGDLPGSFKNLLDRTVGGGEIYGKPVGWVNVSGSPTGAAGAYRALGVVLGYVGARMVEPACVHLPVARTEVGPDGLIADPGVRQRLAEVLAALAEAAAGAEVVGEATAGTAGTE